MGGEGIEPSPGPYKGPARTTELAARHDVVTGDMKNALGDPTGSGISP